MEASKSELNVATDLATGPSYLKPEQLKYVFEQNHCAICEAQLELGHEVNVEQELVKEQAHCPACKIKVRSSHFRLQ